MIEEELRKYVGGKYSSRELKIAINFYARGLTDKKPTVDEMLRALRMEYEDRDDFIYLDDRWELVGKLVDKIEAKFHEGEWVVQEKIGVYKVIEVCESWYEVVDSKDKHYSIGFDKEYMCHLWTIQDAKDGDVLCTYECDEPKIVFILKGTPKKHYALSYHCYYNIMYPHFAPDSEKGCLAPNDEDVKPATKEQRDILFAKMKEAGYEWDAEKKELKKISQRMVSAEAKEALYDKPINQ